MRVDSDRVGGPDSLTELIFLMVVLKIPIVYLCGVVYHAIKSEPNLGPDDWEPVRVAPRPPRHPLRPHGGPVRGYSRTKRAAYVRADRVERR